MGGRSDPSLQRLCVGNWRLHALGKWIWKPNPGPWEQRPCSRDRMRLARPPAHALSNDSTTMVHAKSNGIAVGASNAGARRAALSNTRAGARASSHRGAKPPWPGRVLVGTPKTEAGPAQRRRATSCVRRVRGNQPGSGCCSATMIVPPPPGTTENTGRARTQSRSGVHAERPLALCARHAQVSGAWVHGQGKNDGEEGRRGLTAHTATRAAGKAPQESITDYLVKRQVRLC